MRQRGYTLIEVVMAMTLFGMFLTVLFVLTAEMRGYEKRMPINYHRHPQVSAVLTRMRRDVMDAKGRSPYRNAYGDFTASSSVLIVETVTPAGGVETVVWDFRTPGEVRRYAHAAGATTNWVARGLPLTFSQACAAAGPAGAECVEIDAVKTDDNAAWATRITARDEEGRLAIDAILQPRATE